MLNDRGFTLVELVTVIILVFFVVFGVIGAFLMGNQWFTEEGILRKIRLNHPDISRAIEVLDSERNFFAPSVITVEENGGQRKKFCFDSNIFFSYTETKCNDE